MIDETDDSEIHYKLRKARQLAEVVKQRHRDLADEGITNEVDDEEILNDLRDLGYIE